jgi:hypothetical protein
MRHDRELLDRFTLTSIDRNTPLLPSANVICNKSAMAERAFMKVTAVSVIILPVCSEDHALPVRSATAVNQCLLRSPTTNLLRRNDGMG